MLIAAAVIQVDQKIHNLIQLLIHLAIVKIISIQLITYMKHQLLDQIGTMELGKTKNCHHPNLVF